MISRPIYQSSDWWKFRIWNGWWGANQSASSLGNLAGNSVRNAVGNLVGNSAGNLAGNAVGNSAGNLTGNSVGQSGGEKAYLRKSVIGGNLAFRIGDD